MPYADLKVRNVSDEAVVLHDLGLVLGVGVTATLTNEFSEDEIARSGGSSPLGSLRSALQQSKVQLLTGDDEIILSDEWIPALCSISKEDVASAITAHSGDPLAHSASVGGHRFYTAMARRESDNSADMNVSGSLSTPVDYVVSADVDTWLFIHKIRLVVVDGNIKLNRFGGTVSLSNGFQIILEQSGETVYLVPSAKDFGELIGWSSDFALMQAAYAADDLMYFDFHFPSGSEILLRSSSKLICRVRDDLISLTKFNAFVAGISEAAPEE